MGCSIVNRLSCGAEIQKLCASAVEMLNSLLSTDSEPCPGLKAKDAFLISQSFEDVSPTSLILFASLDEDEISEELVGYTLWHRKAVIEEYPTEPTCTLFKPNNCFFLTGLTPSTDYIFKVIAFGSGGDLEQWEAKTTTFILYLDFHGFFLWFLFNILIKFQLFLVTSNVNYKFAMGKIEGFIA